jgi:ribosomal protein S18 acetylase RimI-like enzyme
MGDSRLSRISEDERERALDTLVLAFAADPVERWMWRGSAEYLAHFPSFLAAFGGQSFAAGTAWKLGDFSAVALWFPPGTEPDDGAIASVVTETVEPKLQGDLFVVAEQMQEAHPTFRHWYLPWLGVDPASHGRGLGGRLLGECLRIVDGDQLPAYLETPNPRTIPFYERAGFAVTGEARSGDCPPVTFMLRSAR